MIFPLNIGVNSTSPNSDYNMSTQNFYQICREPDSVTLYI